MSTMQWKLKSDNFVRSERSSKETFSDRLQNLPQASAKAAKRANKLTPSFTRLPFSRSVNLCASTRSSGNSIAIAASLLLTRFSEARLKLIFALLRNGDPSIRANVVIALGDLSLRFPNLLFPWLNQVYSSLRDKNPRVRKNALQVLTHCVLNDMVKVKGNVSEMALCLVDTEESISNLAKRFFHQLAEKDQLYNKLPDCVSNLLQANIEEETFQFVMKFLLSFVQKDRQNENLIQQFCQRFRTSPEPRQYNNVGFCLAQLNYSDKSIKKLRDNFPLYKDYLHDQTLFHHFQSIITKTRKTKGEAKSELDDLEKTIHDLFKREDGTIEDLPSKPAHEKKAKPKRRGARAKKVCSLCWFKLLMMQI
jgi:condensin complex subunit 1